MNNMTNKHFNIDDVASNTGLNKDTLRAWERRYGFPVPDRNPAGERVYCLEQLDRLVVISRLLDQGFRPGKLVAKSPAELEKLNQELLSANNEADNSILNELIEAIEAGEVSRCKGLILSQLVSRGPKEFVYETVIPLLVKVGDRWAGGRLPIYQEHFITQQLLVVLILVNDQIEIAPSSFRIVLTTIPGERHSLGLLMAEILMRLEGVETVNLGVETPLDQQLEACLHLQPDILALSFSTIQRRAPIISALRVLSQQLPKEVEIMVGGAGVARMRSLPPRIHVVKALNNFETIIRTVKKMKNKH